MNVRGVVLTVVLLALLGGGAWMGSTLLAGGEEPPAPVDLTAAAPEAVERSASTETKLAAPAEVEDEEPELEVARSQEARAVVEASSAPPDAVWVRGRVVFPDGTPVDERVLVTARGKKLPDGSLHTAPASASGEFRVAFSPKTRYARLPIEAKYLFLERVERFKLAELEGEVLLEPRLGARIAGRVLPPAGVEVEPGSVLLKLRAREDVGGGMRSREMQLAAELSEDLTFEFTGLPPEFEYRVLVEADAFVQAAYEGLVVKEGETTTLDVELVRGASVEGLVLDVDAQPVADARITVQTGQSWGQGRYRRVTTEADGRFELNGVMPGDVRITANVEGRAPATLEVGELADGERRAGLVLDLGRGLALRGRVTWPDGKPAKAWLKVEKIHEHGYSSRTAEGESDEEGHFEIEGLQPGSFRLLASAWPEDLGGARRRRDPTGDPRAWSVATEVQIPAGAPVALILEGGSSITGRVVDETGAPVTDRFRVTAAPIDEGENFHGFWGDEVLKRTFTSDDGRFELTGLRDATWHLKVEAEGRADSPIVTTLLPSNAGEHEFVLRSLARLTGSVVDPAGKAVANARVKVLEETTPGSYQDRMTTADEQGLFELDDVRPGRLIVSARKPGFAASEAQVVEASPAGGVSDVVVTLRVGGSIRGQIHPSAGRLDGRRLDVRSDEGGEARQAGSDRDGNFEFEDLVPGKYTLTLQADDRGREGPDDWIVELQERQMLSVEVTAGDVTTCVIGQATTPPVVVRGRVTSGGRPLEGYLVYVYGAGGQAGARTEADGSYEVGLQKTGNCTFRIGRDWNDQLSFAVEVDSAEFRRDFELPLGTLRGVVRDRAGSPASNIPVVLNGVSEDGRAPGQRSTMCDAEGRFELENVGAGKYVVRVGGTRGYWAQERTRYGVTVHEVELSAEPDRPELQLEVLPAGRVVGRVVDEGGAPVARVWIELCTPDGVRAGTNSYAQEDGSFTYGGVGEGTWILRVRGQLTGEVEVRVYEGQDTEVDLVVRKP